jgi:ribosomal protein L23
MIYKKVAKLEQIVAFTFTEEAVKEIKHAFEIYESYRPLSICTMMTQKKLINMETTNLKKQEGKKSIIISIKAPKYIAYFNNHLELYML